MKAVLLSINPKWCELVASGKKTIEVRKTKPKIKPPFKCYIYETKGEAETPFIDEDGHMDFHGRGQVIGEFVCDKITMDIPGYKDYGVGYWDILDGSCLTCDELFNYGRWGALYGWHISDLVIYDTPKELNEFKKPSEYRVMSYQKRKSYLDGFTRPPQSWCYVEEED